MLPVPMSDTATKVEPRVHIPPQGGRLLPFVKGQSGNPSGYGGRYNEVRKICAENSVRAALRLSELIHDADGRIACMAAMAVIERGVGKVRDHSGEGQGRMDLSALNYDERQALATLLAKALGLKAL